MSINYYYDPEQENTISSTTALTVHLHKLMRTFFNALWPTPSNSNWIQEGDKLTPISERFVNSKGWLSLVIKSESTNNLVKIEKRKKNWSRKWGYELNGFGVRRIRKFTFFSNSAHESVADDPVKTKLSEWEAEAEEQPITMLVLRLSTYSLIPNSANLVSLDQKQQSHETVELVFCFRLCWFDLLLITTPTPSPPFVKTSLKLGTGRNPKVDGKATKKKGMEPESHCKPCCPGCFQILVSIPFLSL